VSGSNLEGLLAWQIHAVGLPAPAREHAAIPNRKYRVDFAWPDRRLAVEVEGGIWQEGAHSTGSGITRDIEKANLLALAGWTLIRCTAEHIRSGQALRWIETALNLEGGDM
jgi:very-short-patch-repair endonuclease